MTQEYGIKNALEDFRISDEMMKNWGLIKGSLGNCIIRFNSTIYLMDYIENNELEKGNNSCSVHTLHQILKALKIPADNLLYGEITNLKDEYYSFIISSFKRSC